MPYCGEHVAVNHEAENGLAVTLRCRSWLCEECARLNRWRVKRKAKAGKPDMLITLTSRFHPEACPDEAAHDLVRAWRTIRRRLAARNGGKAPAFMAVFEATKRGWPHLHIVCRSGFIDQRWLSDQMAELTGAPIVDVRRVRNRDRAVQYVAKYLGKDPHRFEGTKRFWTSLDWLSAKAKRDLAPRVFDDPWVCHRMPLNDFEDRIMALGFVTERRGDSIAFWSGDDPP